MTRLATIGDNSSRKISRPLKILVPMIHTELAAGQRAGIEHFRLAGEMLNEAKDQIARGSWTSWLTKNFQLSKFTARLYMRLAREMDEDEDDQSKDERVHFSSMRSALGMKPARHAWTDVHEAADRVNVNRLADERQKRDDELTLHREIALKLIDLGYRAMATRLHPDRGGSRDAMARLNAVRDELKSIAETRRFV
jgi:hypothetical protein